MDKINFVNKPNTDTPINDKNLNKMQDNIETAINEVNDNAVEINENTNNNINKCKTITFNNEWRNAFKSRGNNLTVELPIFNPNNESPTINLTATVWVDGWQTISSIKITAYNTNQVILQLVNNLSLVDGDCYLVKLSGTIITT